MTTGIEPLETESLALSHLPLLRTALLRRFPRLVTPSTMSL